jgi:hypothetical protein
MKARCVDLTRWDTPHVRSKDDSRATRAVCIIWRVVLPLSIPPCLSLTPTIMHANLPLDILHLLLCSLPDLYTLNTTIKVSKHVYTVYNAHANAIRTAVARNEAGPALVQACRLEMSHNLLEERVSVDSIETIVGELPSEAQMDVNIVLKDWSRAQRFSRVVKLTALVENLYSRRSVSIWYGSSRLLKWRQAPGSGFCNLSALPCPVSPLHSRNVSALDLLLTFFSHMESLLLSQ